MPETRPAFDNIAKPAAHDAPPETPKSPADRTFAWIISEMASPIDYSPLLIAALSALSSNPLQASSIPAFRCRNGRVEFTVRTQGVWHALRMNEVEFTMANDGEVEAHSRWVAAANGKSASSREDAAAVRGLSARKTIHLDIR